MLKNWVAFSSLTTTRKTTSEIGRVISIASLQSVGGIRVPTFGTLCYLRYRNRVLLLKKEKGLFGEGKWNAPGGKLFGAEPPEKGAVREMLEETGLRVSGLHFHGLLDFYLGRNRKLDLVVFVFSSERYTGRLKRSREGELRWFSIDQLPYQEMWEDDPKWLPLLLKGRNFIGDFCFSDNYGILVDHKIHLMP